MCAFQQNKKITIIDWTKLKHYKYLQQTEMRKKIEKFNLMQHLEPSTLLSQKDQGW